MNVVTLSWDLPSQYENGQPFPATNVERFELAIAIESASPQFGPAINLPADRRSERYEDISEGTRRYRLTLVQTDGQTVSQEAVVRVGVEDQEPGPLPPPPPFTFSGKWTVE